MKPFLSQTLNYPPGIVDIEIPSNINPDTVLAPIPDSARTFSTNGARIKIPENYLPETITHLLLKNYRHEIKNIIPSSLTHLGIKDYSAGNGDIVIPHHVTNIILDNVNTKITILAAKLNYLFIHGKCDVDLSNVSYVGFMSYDGSDMKLCDIRTLNVRSNITADLSTIALEKLKVRKEHSIINPIISSCKGLIKLYMSNIPDDINEIDESVTVSLYNVCDITSLKNGGVRRTLRISHPKLIKNIVSDMRDLVCLNTNKSTITLMSEENIKTASQKKYILELDVIHKDHIPSKVKSARSGLSQ